MRFGKGWPRAKRRGRLREHGDKRLRSRVPPRRQIQPRPRLCRPPPETASSAVPCASAYPAVYSHAYAGTLESARHLMRTVCHVSGRHCSRPRPFPHQGGGGSRASHAAD